MKPAALRAFYDWTMKLAAHRHAPLAVGITSFADSLLIPSPPEIILIPAALAAREKAWRLAVAATVGSIIGAALAYGIGHFFYVLAAGWLESTGKTVMLDEFRTQYQELGAWFVAAGSFTPGAYKFITLGSGMLGYPFVPFILAVTLGRGVRFFLVAGLLWKFGAPIRGFIEKYMGPLALGFFALLIVLAVGLRFLA